MQNQEYKISSIENRADDIKNLVDQSEKEKNILKKIQNLPNPNKHFFGRLEVLKNIKDLLQIEANSIVTISGSGGIGKTSVALQTAYDPEHQFSGGIYLIYADSNETITTSLHEIALKLDLIDPKKDDIDGNILVNIITKYIKDHKDHRFLMVIDNLNEEDFPELAERIINYQCISVAKVSLIITSRLNENLLKNRISSLSTQKHINLETFSLDEGVEFLKKTSERADIPVNIAREIVQEVDGHPLCLYLIANYLKDSNGDFKNYLKMLKEEDIKVQWPDKVYQLSIFHFRLDFKF